MKIFEQKKGQYALHILEELRKANFEAYLVGGCVRDYLLGLPITEYDITTNAPPAAIEKLFPHTVPVGIKFGVVLVIYEKYQYEVATYRSESNYADGRHPEKVAFSNRKADAHRRDFTINALYWDPFTKTIIDDVGGRKDLEEGIIRAINDPFRRFQEDYLRMLRAIRFYAYLYDLDFSLEKRTIQAVKKLAPHITQISPERHREELNKMLTGPHPEKAIKKMQETGLLQPLLPEVSQLEGVPQPPQFHPEGDVFQHTLLTLYHLKPAPSLDAAWAALLHDIGKPLTIKKGGDRIRFNNHCQVGATMAENVLKRLRFSKQQICHIVKIIRHHMEFINVPHMRVARLKKLLSRPTIEDEIAVHRADCLASHKKLDTYEYLLARKKELNEKEVKPPPLINGNDLKNWGFNPGPIFKDILNNVYEAQLENMIETKEEAKDFVLTHYKKKQQSR